MDAIEVIEDSKSGAVQSSNQEVWLTDPANIEHPVAKAIAMPNQTIHHGRPIPRNAIKVSVTEILQGCEETRIPFPQFEKESGLKVLGETKGYFLLWNHVIPVILDHEVSDLQRQDEYGNIGKQTTHHLRKLCGNHDLLMFRQ